MKGVRRYATATFDDQMIEGQQVPILFALLFLYDKEDEAKAAAERFKMQGPYQWLDQESWLVAWEGAEEKREEIARRLQELDGPLAWLTHHLPEVPEPQAENWSLKTNCYETLDMALSAFGL